MGRKANSEGIDVILISHYDGHSEAICHLTTPYDCAGTCTKERYDQIHHEDHGFMVYGLCFTL